MYVTVSHYENRLKETNVQTQLDSTIKHLVHLVTVAEKDLWHLVNVYRNGDDSHSLTSSAGYSFIQKNQMLSAIYRLNGTIGQVGCGTILEQSAVQTLFTQKSSTSKRLEALLGSCSKFDLTTSMANASLLVQQPGSEHSGNLIVLLPADNHVVNSNMASQKLLAFVLDLNAVAAYLVDQNRATGALGIELYDADGQTQLLYHKAFEPACQQSCEFLSSLTSELDHEFAGSHWHFSLQQEVGSKLSLLALTSSLLMFAITLFALWNMYKQINRTKWADQLVNERTKNLKETNVVLANEIRQRKFVEKELQYKAAHDPLTGLFNRAEFERHLTQELPALQQSAQGIAVLFIDLDNFKLINDSMGHLAGDKVLQLVAERLRDVLRKGDIMARFGGDEFVILQKGINSDSESLALSERIHQSLSKPMSIDNDDFYVKVSIGAHIVDCDDMSYDAILRSADTAMYEAKRSGRNNTKIFKPALHQQAVTQLYLERELYSACEHQQLFLQYQPIYSNDREIKHLEVLVRWLHPDLGFIGPDKFIPLAEANGLIHKLGGWVFNHACQQLVSWSKELAVSRLPKLNINLSPKQFESNDLLLMIDSTLTQTGIRPEQINIEITETCLIKESEQVIKNIQGLHERGFAIFLDDFGTGYSSLSQLYRVELDALKIDKSFVWQLNSSENKREVKLLEGIVLLAKGLGIETVAEGVETPEQEAILKKVGCQLFQGYLYSKPVDSDTILALLTEESKQVA